MNILIRQITVHDPEYQDEIKLRLNILRYPIGLKSFTEDERNQDLPPTIHLCAFFEFEMVGCLLMNITDDGINKCAKMRQVAVSDKFQGKGIGKLLILKFEEICRSSNIILIKVHARLTALPFYIKLGYVAKVFN